MEASGLRTAVSTTESARIGTRPTSLRAPRPLPASFVRRCRRSGIECLVVELCSSVLRWDAQQGLDLDAAVLTNIGTDHIVGPRQRPQLRGDQKRLFRDLAPGPASPRPVAILNTDYRCFGAFRATSRHGRPPEHLRARRPPGRRRRSVAGRVAEPHGRALEADSDGTCLIVHGLARRPPALSHAAARPLQCGERPGGAGVRGRARRRPRRHDQGDRGSGPPARALRDRGPAVTAPPGHRRGLRAHAGEPGQRDRRRARVRATGAACTRSSVAAAPATRASGRSWARLPRARRMRPS